ncbi:YdeI/OmpD-associated family protein [Patescibacteria group bacterium]|nr:YdeI/OmpD-associated family protein [Patescibacteria group bacterium]
MQKTPIEKGTIHELPADMQTALLANEDVLTAWNSLTPLARNERICRVTIVKKEETRTDHIRRL